MSEVFNYKTEIEALERRLELKTMTPGAALAMLGLKLHEHFSGVVAKLEAQLADERRLYQMKGGRTDLPGAVPVRVSFRKNVEIAPFRHEHAEVTVELNGSTLAEATEIAKDAVDDVLGVKELRTAQEQIDNAKQVLKNAARERANRRKGKSLPSCSRS